ncbi:MAG TPA: OmpA family protein [Thermoanaerobaculia bacterium]|nr:OmpA family protein [Thermoanaerobaculia bacterium]
MKRIATFWALTLLVALAAGGVVSAADLQLTSVLYPEKKDIDVPFAVTAIGPKGAEVAAEVEYKAGQAQIEISYKNMQPAILFAGNITQYAVWAVTADGTTENLGALNVVEPKGSQKFSTGQKQFAMIVTAEPISGTWQPSTLVVLVSGKAKQLEGQATTFAFNRFAGPFYQNLIKPGNPSIADLKYAKGGEPVELMKARKLVELAGNPAVSKYDPKTFEEAKLTLAQATNTVTSGGSEKVITDYSARASAKASEVIRLAVRKEYEAMKAAEEAKKAAEKSALQQGLATTTAERDALEVEKKKLEADKKKLEAEKAQIKAERDALEARLAGALSKIMTVTETARGLAVDIGDVLFDVNKATLKPAARESLAKMSGVLLILPDVNLRIEGFTDSTGTAERNKVLSAERAKSVDDYLLSQGIDASRMSHAGYGPANPVADTATAEGRAKNRRVVVTFAKGVIEPMPGGYTAPDKPAAPAKAPAKKEAKPAAKPAEPAKKG